MSDLDLRAVMARYSKALDAKPGKGDIGPDGIAAITDSVCDVPQLLALVDELGTADNAALRAGRDDWRTRYEDMRTEAQRLGRVIERRNDEVVRLRAVAAGSVEALRDFAEHGTRHDLNPTMPGGDQGLTHLLRYIERMDTHVRETARRALGVDHG